MNILLLCNKSPFPPKEGGAMVMYAALTGLIETGNHVKILTFSSNKFPTHSIPETLEEYVEKVDINLNINPLKAFSNLFSKKSLHILRFINKEMQQKLVRILETEKFDIIQLESLFMTPYIDIIRKHSDAKIILRAHNIEYRIWERIAYHCKNPVKKAYINLLSKRLKHHEKHVINQVDGIATLSQVDLAHFRELGCRKPMIAIPFSIDADKFSYRDYGDPEPRSFFHLGSMDWIPNQEGIRWFLEFIWPEIRRKNPDATFYLAGRNIPEWIAHNHFPGVVVVGEVADAQTFMRSKSILTVPLLSGSGIRIKIIEGMACARPILTTSIGAEGIDYSDGKNIMIADNHQEFIEKSQQLLDNQQLCKNMGMEAHKLIVEKYNNKIIIADLTNFYQLCLENK